MVCSNDQPEFSDSAKSGPDTSMAPAERAIEQDIFCPGCGYNLRALTGVRCPECGHDLESIRSRESIIPWVHRRRIGRFRAYWKTVWLASFHVNRLCNEMARPVSHADSQRFRWATILHVFVPVVASVTIHDALDIPYVEALNPIAPSGPSLFDRFLAEVWSIETLAFCLLLFLVAATGVPSYFFHPRGMPTALQNRAIALSYYVGGTLAFVGVLPLLVEVVMIAVCAWSLVPPGFRSSWINGYVSLAAWLSSALVFVIWWWDHLLRAARMTMPQVDGRATLVALLVPPLWLALGGLILLALPLVIFGILVIFASLD